MDTTLTSDTPTTDSSGTAETTTPDVSTGTETAASENNQADSGTSQERTEGSQQEQSGRRKPWSMQDTVKELRAERRELRSNLQEMQSQLQELREAREAANRRPSGQVEKTPADFWADPESRIRAIQEERLSAMEERMVQRFQQTREQEYQQQAIQREVAQGIEFIQSQKSYSTDDDEDIAEIVETHGLRNLPPMNRAQAAWAILQQSRGVSDRSVAKQRASGVQGQAPGQGFGRKTWSKSEFDNAIDLVSKNPNDPKHNDLIKELEAAHKEGRVK
jgi:hypothetical protein